MNIKIIGDTMEENKYDENANKTCEETQIKNDQAEIETKKNPLPSIIGAIVGLLMSIMLIVNGCNGLNSSKNNFTISNKHCNYKLDMGYYEGYFTCEVKNNSNKSYSYVYIECSIYNSNGSLVDTVNDVSGYLGPNETWSVSAYYMYDASKGKPSGFKVTSINGY